MRKSAFVILLLLFMAGCGDDKLRIDTGRVEIPEIKTLRLEQDLFAISEGNFSRQTELLKGRYGLVFEHFLMNPLHLMGTKDTLYKEQVLGFTGDREVRAAYNDAEKIYSDIGEISEGVNEMAKRFHHHFPDRKIPAKFITTISGWNYAVAYMDSALILSLDMYLGDTSRFYKMLSYPKYQTRKMNRDHILPDLARGWILTEMDTVKPENTLLNHTIFYGKLFYSVQALLPETADSLIIGYTADQIKTCNKYEKEYWGYMAEKNRLYENSFVNIRELTSEGPFTAAISHECPPRIAMWIGWQIVRSYMKNNQDATLDDLINERDAQKILSKSKYRP